MIALVIEEPGRPLRRVQLASLPACIGRGDGLEVRLYDDQVSRRHALIEDSPAGPRIRDLAAANGTFRDGERVACALLRRGAKLGIGNAQITYVGDDDDSGHQGPVLRFESLGEGAPRWVEVGRLPAVIGRRDDADVPIDDGEVSRDHARLESGVSLDQVVLVDLGSSNGTHLNGKRIRQATLSAGDELRVGSETLRFLGGRVPSVAPRADVAVQGLEILGPLGAGVVSDVYLARQIAMDREVALRILKSEWRDATQVKERFTRLARAQARIGHHGLAGGIDVGEKDGVPYFVTEALVGETLDVFAARTLGVSADVVIDVLRQLLELASHVHGQGAVLGSIVPRRIIRTEDGRLELTRLGFPLPDVRRLPRALSKDRAFLAPEALIGDPESAGPPGDLYQIGACVWSLVVNRPPRDPTVSAEEAEGLGEPRASTGRPLPAALAELIVALGARDPALRPASADDALRRLEEAEAAASAVGAQRLAEARRVADSAGPPQRSSASAARMKLLSRTLTVLIGLGLNGGLFWWWQAMGPGAKKKAPSVVEQTEPTPAVTPTIPEIETSSVPSDPVVTAAEDAASAAFEKVNAELREVKLPSERIALLIRFAEAHVGSKAGASALVKVAEEKEGWRSRAGTLLDQVEQAIESGSLAAARRALVRAEPLSKGVADDRFAALADRVGRMGGEFSPDVSEAPVTSPAPPVERPKKDVGKLIARAMTSPADAALRTEALAAAPDDERMRRELRVLLAYDRVLPVSFRSLADSGRVLTLVVAGTSRSGQVVRSESSSVTLLRDGVEDVVDLKSLSGKDLAPVIAAASPSGDRYLLRALTAIEEQRWDDAWFDVQGFLLAGKDPDDRRFAEDLLVRLTKLAGTRESPKR